MTNIILIGIRAAGKSTIGRHLAKLLNISFIDSDRYLENYFQIKKEKKLSVREIYKTFGPVYFEKLEKESLKSLSFETKKSTFILSCGGKTPLIAQNRKILKKMGIIIFLNTAKNILLKRILKDGIPATFPYQDDPERSLNELLKERLRIYRQLADHTLNLKRETPDEIVGKILKLI